MVIALLSSFAALALRGQIGAMPDPLPGAHTDTVKRNVVTADGKRGSVTAKVTATFSLGAPTLDGKHVMAGFYCSNKCLGKTHDSHTLCTSICDETCEFTHSESVPFVPRFNSGNCFSAQTMLERTTLDSCGLSALDSPTVDAIRNTISTSLRVYDTLSRPVTSAHFADPCSSAAKSYTAKIFPIIAKIHTETTVVLDGKEETDSFDSELTVATVDVVDDEHPQIISKDTACKCTGVPPKTITGVRDLLQLDGPIVIDDWGGFRFYGGLDGAKLHAEMPLGGHANFAYAPGTRLIPEDPEYQELVLLWGEFFGYDDWDIPPPPPHGPSASFETPTLQVACTQMLKKMPYKMKFKIAPPKDPMMRKLAAIGKDALIRGMDDQPRIWIYTDKATIDQVNEHLFPRATPSVYLRALHQCAGAGALNLKDEGYRKCVEPKLMKGLLAPAAAKVWLIQTLDVIDPKGLVSFLQAEGASFGGLIKVKAEERGMGELIDALLSSRNAAVVEAVPSFLQAAIPPDKLQSVLDQSKIYQAMKKRAKQ